MPEPTSPSAADIVVAELEAKSRALLTEQERLVSSSANPEARARLAVIATELRALSVSIATARARSREARLIAHNAKVLELQPRLTTLQRKIAKTLATLRQDRREEMRLVAQMELADKCLN